MSGLTLWAALAWRNIRRNRRRSLLTILLIAVGALALLLSLGYMAASFAGIKFGIIQGGTGHLQIAQADEFADHAMRPLEYALTPAQGIALAQLVDEDARVRRIVPRLLFQGLISNGERSEIFTGTGVEPSAEWSAFGRGFSIEAGEFLPAAPAERFSVLLGRRLAEKLNARIGDTLTLLVAAATGSVNAVDVKLAGTLQTGSAEQDSFVLFMPLRATQELMRSDKVSRYAVLLREPDAEQALRQTINQRFPELQTKNWQELAPIYDQIVRMYRDLFSVLGVIILLLIFMAVLNTIMMNVFERSREIGTMRAVGIPARWVRGLFILEGSLLGALGGAAGGLLSFLISTAIRFSGITTPPPPGRTLGNALVIAWDWRFIVAALLVMSLLGGLAAWFASRHVTRLQVLDALNAG